MKEENKAKVYWKTLSVRFPRLGRLDERNFALYEAGFFGREFTPREVEENPLDKTEAQKAIRRADKIRNQEFWHKTGSADGIFEIFRIQNRMISRNSWSIICLSFAVIIIAFASFL